jgi:hypothetical protein
MRQLAPKIGHRLPWSLEPLIHIAEPPGFFSQRPPARATVPG